MKRSAVISVLVFVLFLTVFAVVRAETRGRYGWCGHRWHHLGPANYLAHELKLSDAQKAQIRTLLQAERPVFSAHIHEFLAENKEMNAIAANANPDQNEVQKIADREANTIATMLMEKAHLQSKIYFTILNSDQRAKADELQKKWGSRLDRLADRLETQPAEK